MQVGIDVGNTNISFGFFSNERNDLTVKASFRITTPSVITTDELTGIFRSFMKQKGIADSDITHGIFSSVVPELNHNITKMMHNTFQCNIHMVTKDMFVDIEKHYYDIESLGTDRLLNLMAASTIYGKPLIVVDLGTAITLDILNADNVFLGGMIMPGIAVSLEALVKQTSKLPMIELEYPKKILGNSTKECMQNGIYYLNSFGLKGILTCVLDDFFPKQKTHIIATGGLSRYATNLFKEKVVLDSELALKGLKILLDKQRIGR